MSARMPKGCSVFLVEDEVMIRIMVADMLQELGHHLAGEASRVDEAIELVRKTHFDIAIMDINLHGEWVFPVAEAIEALNHPFIFATGYKASILPARFSDRPALQKPFRKETLGELIEATVKDHRLSRMYRRPALAQGDRREMHNDLSWPLIRSQLIKLLGNSLRPSQKQTM